MKFAYLIEPPFNYIDNEGHVTGCDVELARYVFSQLGIDHFEPVEVEFSELLPGVGDRRWHMTTGLFGTKERSECASFSHPIWALPDGFLVQQDNPMRLTGYASVANTGSVRLAVIRDQFQHRSAVDFGIPEERIEVFDTYTQAATAVRDGQVDAYASVGRAHSGFIHQNPDWDVSLVLVPAVEKPPAFGSFAFALDDVVLRNQVNAVLSKFLGSKEHRHMVARFGFSDEEVDLVMATNTGV